MIGLGIDICEKNIVTINNTHQDGVDTSILSNPNDFLVGAGLQKIKTSCIYKRKRLEKRDGNPFIYALKSKDGYSVNTRNIALCRSDFYEILNKSTANNPQSTYYIPLPSSHKIANFLAKKAAITSGGSLVTDYLEKTINADIYAQILGILGSGGLNKNKKKGLKSLAKFLSGSPLKTFSMKDVDTNIRELINPIKLSSVDFEVLPPPSLIVLVDDLVATGSTLCGAAAVLKGLYPNATISALAFISPVQPEKP